MSAHNSKLAAVFVVIVVVLVGGAAVAPFALGSSGGDDPAAVENQQFQPENVLADRAAEDGEVTMGSDAERKTILVDVGHRNDVSESQLDPLLSTLAENGHRIRYYRGQRASLNESLRSADAFLVVSPRERYAADELAGVEAFTDAGGRLLVMGDPPTVELSGGLFFGSLEPVASRTSSLGSTYGIAYGTGYLYNMEENDNNFKSIFARPAGESALTDGVDRVVMREAVPIRTGDATDVMVGSQGTHLSETRDAGQYAVVARNGNVVAVGDTDFVSRENAYDADNEALIGNIADFLVDGDKESGAPADPERGRERPSDGVPPRGDPAPTPPPS